jgi:outer membrane lipoprotein-sorting protein
VQALAPSLRIGPIRADAASGCTTVMLCINVNKSGNLYNLTYSIEGNLLNMANKSDFFRRVCPTLLVLLVAFSPMLTVNATRASKETAQIANFTSKGPLVQPMKDGEVFIDTMYKNANQLNDYSMVFETTVFKKGSTVHERGNLYFKKPKLMRLEETGDYKKGSVAVLGKDGKVRAHSGGVLKLITVTMDPDDKQLNAANGDAMKGSDFVSLALSLKNKIKQGVKSRVSEKPLGVEGIGQPAYVLEMYYPSDPSLVLKRIYVDPSTYLPVRWDDYDYKNPCASVWRNVKTSIGLGDELFKM